MSRREGNHAHSNRNHWAEMATLSTFTHDCSRFVWGRLIRDKSVVSKKFHDLVNESEKDTGCKLKPLRSDRGGDYLADEFQQYLKRHRIHHQLTNAESPEQNGVAERMNRKLLEKARAMMAATNIPNTFWAEAIANAAMRAVQRLLCKT